MAIAAVAVLGLLPTEHVHAGNDSGDHHAVIQHRHVIDETSHDGDTAFEHPDHTTARFLISAFEISSKFAPDRPVTMTSAVVIAPPLMIIGHRATVDNRPIHGPPGPALPARAPPSRV